MKGSCASLHDPAAILILRFSALFLGFLLFTQHAGGHAAVATNPGIVKETMPGFVSTAA